MVYDLSSRLIYLRKKRAWTQKQLSEKIEISDSAIGNYENDTATPSLQVAAAMADIFNVSLDYLAEGEKCRTITVKGLNDIQVQLLADMVQEFSTPSGHGACLADTQKDLLARVIEKFVK